MRASDLTLEQAKKEIAYWQMNYSRSFVQLIIDAYAKADGGNKATLLEAFPMLCLAYEDWYNCPDSAEWIEKATSLPTSDNEKKE